MRYSAETNRLLQAISAMRTSEECGIGAAYYGYIEKARKSAAIIIGRGLAAMAAASSGDTKEKMNG